MTAQELKSKLDELGVHPNEYSLEGELKPDAIILFKNYNEWQVFYLSERGDRENLKIFKDENQACLHIWDLFLEDDKIKKEFLNGRD